MDPLLGNEHDDEPDPFHAPDCWLAQELGPRKITANVVAPGAIATDFGGGMLRDNPEVNRWVASLTALGRVGLPDDMGGAVAMLLAPEAAGRTASGPRSRAGWACDRAQVLAPLPQHPRASGFGGARCFG